MSEDKKLVWLVNNIAGLRLEQKEALGTSQFDFREFHSENEAARSLNGGGKNPDVIIAGSNILEKISNIPVINATGIDSKKLKEKVDEKLSVGVAVKASMER